LDKNLKLLTMKRTIFLAIIMISVVLSAFSQNPECIYCGSNELIETSSAIGNLNQNLGEYSLTIGNSNKIGQKLKLVTLIGYNNIANGNLIGNYSGAFGINNLIQSDKSYIIGNDDTVSATMAISIGNRSKVSGQYSLAIGKDIKVSGFGSVGLGINSHVSGNFSAAIGNNAYANAMNSYSFGNNVWSDAIGSMTIGTSGAFLKNTTPNSLIIGFNSDLPTFFVSSSMQPGFTGKVGIGNVTDPQAKLHIRADATDDATLRLEPGTGKVSRIYFSNSDDYYVQAANNQNMIFRTPANKNFNFENGKIIASSLLISTEFGSGKLLQSDASGNAVWTIPAWTISGSNVYKTTGKVGIGTTVLNNTLEIAGYANTSSGYKVGNTEVINSTRNFSGNNGYFEGTLNVTGTSTLNGNLTVAGNSAFNGNVGIGVPTPQKKLDVNGDINFSGNLYKNNQPVNLSGYWASNGNNIYYNSGNVGIGTDAPQAPLQVDGNAYFLSENPNNQLQILFSGTAIPARRGIKLTNDPDGAFNFYIHGNQGQAAFNFKDGLNDNNLMTIKKDGNVGIGTTTINGYKLSVAGKILAEELQIQLVQDWYDNVFEEDYSLMDLNELESFVKQNNHLPDIPSEAEVKENGIRVGEMNALLLKKVEELTLYIIEQQKMLENQHTEISNLKKLFESKNNQ